MLEFEIPFVCLIFTALISIAFFTKKKIGLKENRYYKNILILTLLVNTTNFISHYMASFNAEISDAFATCFASINKLGSFFIVFITSNILTYLLYISYDKYRENSSKYRLLNFGLNSITGILIFIFDFEVYKINGITSGKGLSVTFTFSIVFIYLFLAFVVALINRKKYDKRYNAIYFIIPLIFLLGVFVLFHPQFNIYDLILSLLCYIMYFTIENPDVEMINEITLTKNELEKANNIKNEFIASMSHEMRTPLNAIMGFNEINDYANSLDEVKENNKEIKEACNNLLDMIENTFDVISLGKTTKNFECISYNPKETILKVIDLYRKRIEEKGVYLEENIDDLPYLLGDSKVIQKITNNVLNNAYKYTEKGLIKIEVKYQKEELLIKISDTGIGIKEELQDIFKPFVKSSETKDSKYSGIGLGLSITKSLIDKLKGSINITSEYQNGTTILIKIKQKEATK